jgi:hypothetical protein
VGVLPNQHRPYHEDAREEKRAVHQTLFLDSHFNQL